MLRAKIKDHRYTKNVRRKYKDQDATLVVQPQNWIAIDIDGYGIATGDLQIDASQVILQLPSCFQNIDYFALASSRYGMVPEIHCRLFFWNKEPISNQDLKTALAGYDKKANVDMALFNPIQPIYTAKPEFIDVDDPVKERIKWITPFLSEGDMSSVKSRIEKREVAKEPRYTKEQADKIIASKLRELGAAVYGTRHDTLYEISRIIGKRVWEKHIEESEAVRLIEFACKQWTGPRDVDKDYATIYDAIARGQQAMEWSNQHAE